MNNDRLLSAAEAGRILSVQAEEFRFIARMAGPRLNPLILPGLEDPFRWRLSSLWAWVAEVEAEQAIAHHNVTLVSRHEIPTVPCGPTPPLPTAGYLRQLPPGAESSHGALGARVPKPKSARQ